MSDVVDFPGPRAAATASDFDWLPLSTGDVLVDEIIEVAFALGRKVGRDDDPVPHRHALDVLVDEWRRRP